MRHENDADEIVLWRSAGVKVDDSHSILVLYYYHTEKADRSKAFYRCAARLDSNENWKKLTESLTSENPGDFFRLPMIGIEDDYRLYYSRRTFTKASMYQWMNRKFTNENMIDLKNFIDTNKTHASIAPFLLEFSDGHNIENLESGKWSYVYREKKERKHKAYIQ